MAGEKESSTKKQARFERLVELASRQGEVVSLEQLHACGVTRGEFRAQLAARRWRRVGRQSMALHTGPLLTEGLHWAAVFEAGPRAHLDGASALLAHGLVGFDTPRTRVSVPRGARIRRRRTSYLDIRETRRFDPEDVCPSGVPRTRPAVAAIRGALWARTDREASLLVTMCVQQGLCTVEDLGIQLMRIKRDKRRQLLADLVIDLAGGIRSLTELDFVRGCRERGLPEPDKQVLRKVGDNRYYLDFHFEEYAVTVEIDGIQHGWAAHAIADAQRHNVVALQRGVVLRLPVLGLRVCPETFYDQVRAALVDAGWTDLAASA